MAAATAAETAVWKVASSSRRVGFLLVDWLRLLGGMVFPIRKGTQADERRWLTLDISILTMLGLNFSRASDIGCLSVDLHPYDVVLVFKVGV